MSEVQYTVLIADDESTIRNGLREVIPWGMYHAQVVAAEQDGLSALAAIRRLKPDLAVIDIKMPGMDGIDVVRTAREEGIMTRFLILSGYSDFSYAQQAIRYGVSAYFLKPLRVEEFKDELSRQFAQIMKEHGFRRQAGEMDALLETSRLFLLNQLIRSEIRNQEELVRRCSLLSLKLQPDKPCRVIVFTAVCDDEEELKEIIPSVEKALLPRCKDRVWELWSCMGRHVITVIPANEPTTSELNGLSDLLLELERELGYRIIAGIGPCVTTAMQAAQSYSTALRALSYDMYQLPERVYLPSIICTQMPAPNYPDSSVYENVTKAMDSSSEEEIAAACQTFVNALRYVPMPPPDYLRGKCIALATSICSQFSRQHPDAGPFTPPQAEDALHLHTVAQLEQWLTLTLTGYHESHRKARRLADPLIESAKSYILSHLSDNIKASDVAAEVNLSTSYFTIYFKAKAGCNFRDYVLNEKMRYARELMQKGMNVSEIAYAIGYTDYRSFSRAFKNVTGHTPSDYMRV